MYPANHNIYKTCYQYSCQVCTFKTFKLRGTTGRQRQCHRHHLHPPVMRSDSSGTRDYMELEPEINWPHRIMLPSATTINWAGQSISLASNTSKFQYMSQRVLTVSWMTQGTGMTPWDSGSQKCSWIFPPSRQQQSTEGKGMIASTFHRPTGRVPIAQNQQSKEWATKISSKFF